MSLAYLYDTIALADDGTVIPIRICSGAGYNDPTAPGYFEPCIKGADDTSSGVSVQRSVFASGAGAWSEAPSRNSVSVQLCHLRSRLNRLGVVIETRRCEGYAISESDKCRLRELIASETTPASLAA